MRWIYTCHPNEIREVRSGLFIFRERAGAPLEGVILDIVIAGKKKRLFFLELMSGVVYARPFWWIRVCYRQYIPKWWRRFSLHAGVSSLTRGPLNKRMIALYEEAMDARS